MFCTESTRSELSKVLCYDFYQKINIYYLGTSEISRVDSFQDLGILFDKHLLTISTFVDHIKDVVAKAFRAYDFIYHNCRDFTNIQALSVLYFALVRSRLEYCACIWFPMYELHVKHLESVQRKYLQFPSFVVDETYTQRGLEYKLLLKRFKFTSLKTHEISCSISFLWNNRIDYNGL